MEDDDAYGPALPPWIANKTRETPEANMDDDDDMYGPSLPPHLRKKNPNSDDTYNVPLPPDYTEHKQRSNLSDEYCPPLPSHLLNKKNSTKEDNDNDVYSAELPPHLLNKKKNTSSRKDSGPDVDSAPLPPHLLKSSKNSHSETDNNYGAELPPHLKNKRVLGPMIPTNFQALVEENKNKRPETDESEDDDDYAIGPMPSSTQFDRSEYNQQQIELRAKKMKDKLCGKGEEKKLERESWMTELPDGKPNLFGLTGAPRQFRKKAVELGDRSVWTDTPQDKERKSKMGKNANSEPELTPELIASKKRDKELEGMVSEYNTSKRGSALIDMHQAKIKKKKEDNPTTERRPFSREVDLSVNKFDEAQKSAILKKARNLDDRFSAGGKKFL